MIAYFVQTPTPSRMPPIKAAIHIYQGTLLKIGLLCHKMAPEYNIPFWLTTFKVDPRCQGRLELAEQPAW